eukprot:2394159-Rhodomonas_salina.3
MEKVMTSVEEQTRQQALSVRCLCSLRRCLGSICALFVLCLCSVCAQFVRSRPPAGTAVLQLGRSGPVLSQALATRCPVLRYARARSGTKCAAEALTCVSIQSVRCTERCTLLTPTGVCNMHVTNAHGLPPPPAGRATDAGDREEAQNPRPHPETVRGGRHDSEIQARKHPKVQHPDERFPGRRNPDRARPPCYCGRDRQGACGTAAA